MNIRLIPKLMSCLGVIGLLTTGFVQAEQAAKPNIILILTDDQGYGDLARHGHPLLNTPHTDRLHDESVRFDNFYVSPSCSPTRAALLTGMHEFRNGVTHTLEPREHLYKGATIIPQLLKPAGYTSAFIGKWHLSDRPGYGPAARGFDWCSSNQKGPHKHFDPLMIRNGVRTERKGFREDIYFDEAMDFIDEQEGKPFFCYLATYSPHTPLDAPADLIAKYSKDVNEKHATYLAMIENIDQNVGRLTEFLEKRGLAENTIVIFMNDNGVTVGLDVYNAEMRGCKATIWHGGSRAMSFWKWPGKWKPHTVNSLTAHLDVVPTLCEVAGVEIPDALQAELQGYSLTPLLENAEAPKWAHENRKLFQAVGRWPSGTAASHKYAMCGVRKGHFLLMRSESCTDPVCEEFQSQCSTMRSVRKGLTTTTYANGTAQTHWGVTPRGQWILFDTKNDPGCQTDLSQAHPELVAELVASYDNWWDEQYPVMIERGGDLGDPMESANAARRVRLAAAKVAAQRLKETEAGGSTTFKRMDTNGDQQVTREEYVALFSKAFVSIDTDNDGALSSEEVKFPAFAKADSDGNGFLSPAEHSALYAEQFDSRDDNNDKVLTASEF